MTGEGAWRRLSVRVVHLDLVRVALSCVPGYLGAVVLNDDGPVWALVAGSAAGVLGALTDLLRWMTTRYRIGPDRVEMRSGWAARRHRTVARDRIRSVDSSAKALQRLFRLRVVHVGSGEHDSSFKLNALDRRHAALLERELLSGAAAPEPEEAPAETVIARLRWQWVPLNIVTIWAVFLVAGPLFSLYWLLRPFGVDLLGVARGLADWGSLGVVGSVLLCAAVGYPIGVAAAAGAFLLENWGFELVRAGTPPATALVSRRGLLGTRTVQRDDRRLRGLAFREPLAWRWLGLAETKVVTTGLSQVGDAGSGALLPRLRLGEAREVAARVLADGHRPLEAPLRRHPRGALVRRLGWAAYGPALLAGLLLLFTLSGALPGWVWPLPLTVMPVTLPMAVVAYRSLGHTTAGPYLVVRGGALHRETVTLRRGAVIGWTFEQSILQRWGGRMTVGIPTAAGDRFYRAPDAGTEQALSLAREATPELAAQFIEEASDPGVRPVSARTDRVMCD
ncbi:hypothetical protein Ade02nite_21780 [Paractinoplanes deccanensis]|uniref:YdbS-like PH domain-containing protein n=1 Tax=Paractinoplanes deccanensis TaxID=113561 RepID=A0ABQ3Y0N2_9ACTN|nr:PH domain-containing protein [Actinoplanes deccanensis]GID73537.1 hypothetical protein Ade02nite_21780 [Actinoplanes deccanensis]